MSDINYTKRYSRKAKYLQLRLSTSGLEVVIPNRLRVTTTTIEDFIQQKRDWIKKHENKLPKENTETKIIELPTFIHLKSIDQLWEVNYLPTAHQKIMMMSNPSNEISLLGNINDKSRCLEKLREWLQEMAEVHLVNYLNLFSQEIDLPFNQVRIRNNTTRWGSCSSKLDISLCCKLLFLPFPLMRHILLHELCHTKVLNHGKKFWKLLNRFDEHAALHVKQIKEEAKLLPNWVLKENF